MSEWISVDVAWPDMNCDIKLVDGSIIRNVTPQIDRDFYWKMPNWGDCFIDEYAVTEWRIPEPPSSKG